MNDHAPRHRAPIDEAAARRDAIVSLVSESRVGSQAELARLLRKRGHTATQATLSRDLRVLGIGKRPGTDGRTAYALPTAARDLLARDRQQLEIEAFVQDVLVVGNLALVRTPPGNANGVARAIDLLDWAEVSGTLAGDDTILIVAADATRAQRFRRRLLSMARREIA
jgi:transcriptional regulator of arginine metabolism